MITVAAAVGKIVASSDFAIEGLQNGSLNLTAYAALINREVETLTKKPVKKGSVVVALARLAKKYRSNPSRDADFKLYNLVSRSNLTELAYPKTNRLQKSIAHLFERADIQAAPFFVATVGLGEISIVTHNDLAESIQHVLKDASPTLHLAGLASLTMQVAIETIDTPRQSYTVIKQLALRDITIVEYITSPTELTIILYERDLKEAFVILHDRFFNHDNQSL